MSEVSVIGRIAEETRAVELQARHVSAIRVTDSAFAGTISAAPSADGHEIKIHPDDWAAIVAEMPKVDPIPNEIRIAQASIGDHNWTRIYGLPVRFGDPEPVA